MIRTLRITSVTAVVLAVVFFVLPAFFSVRGDGQIEQFLNSAGVIEKFNDAKGGGVGDSRQETSPLVKQAEMFALHLDPPPKPQPPPKSPISRDKPRPPGRVTPKFKLIGTSYYTLRPESSLALIDEPGKGLRWVKQSGEVGHLIIEEVKDGLVVVRDGARTFEIVAERPERKSLLKEDSPAQVGVEETVIPGEEIEVARKDALEELDAMMLEMGIAQEDIEPAETNSAPNTERIALAEAKRRRISSGENMRISPDEAKKLGRLGRRLKDVKTISNRRRTNIDQNGANMSEPNLGDVNNPR